MLGIGKSRLRLLCKMQPAAPAADRERFNLFLPEIYVRPLTYEYGSAQVYTIPGGGYELRMSAMKHTVLVVNKDPRGIEILADYIDRYEEVVESKQGFGDKWNIIDYDNIVLPC